MVASMGVEIEYFRDGAVFIVENPHGIRLRYGTSVWTDGRWIVNEETLKILRGQNATIKFVEVKGEGRS